VALPTSYESQPLVFEWLEALVTAAGRDATRDALDYYESLGWLSGSARAELVAFLEGLSSLDPEEGRSLDVADHRQSLQYVARLAHQRR
jgi:archaellum component FlaD/FlaE